MSALSGGEVRPTVYDARVYRNAGNPALLALVRPVDRFILDVGCGAGDNARLLIAAGAVVHGLTLSRAELEAARAVMPRVTLANVETWEPDYAPDTFDAILLSHVVEHLVDPVRAVTSLARLLKPGGRILVATPNVAHWAMRAAVLTGRFDYQDAGPLDRTHLHFYTFFTAPTLFERTGLRCVQTTVSGFAPLRPLRRVWPALAGALDRQACRRWPNLFGYEVLVVAEKPRS